jgi:hypothetical protein
MGDPRARTRGLFVERVDDGLVVYDDESKLAHSLTAEVCAVWELCDGMRTAERIAAASGLDGPLVGRAIGELTECGLLEGMGASHRLVSRREAARRLIGTGGAALSAPLIYSLVIGPATAAASTCASNCSNGTVIASSSCSATTRGTMGTSTACASGLCYQSDANIITCVPAGCIVGGGLNCNQNPANGNGPTCCAGASECRQTPQNGLGCFT